MSRDKDPDAVGAYQYWVLTIWYTDPTRTELVLSDYGRESLRYFVAQLEEAPRTERLHWQGYGEFHRTQKRGRRSM